MISIKDAEYGLNIAIYNEFELSDFKELEDAIGKLIEHRRQVNLFLDLTMLRAYTIDMAIEQLKFLHANSKMINYIAIICDDIWIRLGSVISDFLTDTHPEYFKDAKEAETYLIQKTLAKNEEPKDNNA